VFEVTRIGLDTSKAVFSLHCVNSAGQVVHRADIRRGRLLAFLAKLPPVQIALEACGGAHHWARELNALGHEVRLIPPQYVKPFVKRSKTDRADAEAICEAASRPAMRFVRVKTAEQQAQALALKVRETLVSERTRLINCLRGHACEFGLVSAQGTAQVEPLLRRIAADPTLPAAAREMLALLGAEIAHLDERLAELDARLRHMQRAHPVARLLQTIPGVGPIAALSFVLEVEPADFKSGRHLAAWLGLVPREHSSGGKRRLGGISRAGNERLRQLLVLGATTVIRYAARPGHRLASPWLTRLLARRPRKLAAVALANKMARIIWAMMSSGEVYRRTTATA
jgi:transposase